MNLRILNSSLNRKSFLRSDATIANPLQGQLSNLSSSLASQQLQSFNNYSTSSSPTAWQMFSMFLNAAGVALMGAMTYFLFKGNHLTGKTKNTKASSESAVVEVPIEVKVKVTGTSTKSAKNNRNPLSEEISQDPELRELLTKSKTNKPLEDYIERLINIIFQTDAEMTNEQIINILQNYAKDPDSPVANAKMKNLIQTNLRDLTHLDDLILEIQNTTFLPISPQYLQHAFLYTDLLPILEKSYDFLYLGGGYVGRHFSLDHVLPELEKQIQSHPQPLKSEDSLRGDSAINPAKTQEFWDSIKDLAECEKFEELGKREAFLDNVDPPRFFDELLEQIKNNELDEDSLLVSHPTQRDERLKIRGIKFFLNDMNTDVSMRNKAGIYSQKELLLLQKQLVWSLKEAIETQIAAKII